MPLAPPHGKRSREPRHALPTRTIRRRTCPQRWDLARLWHAVPTWTSVPPLPTSIGRRHPSPGQPGRPASRESAPREACPCPPAAREWAGEWAPVRAVRPATRCEGSPLSERTRSAAQPGTPTWFSPKEEIPHTASQVAQPAPAPTPQPTPAPPAGTGKLPVAQIPATPAAPAAPAKGASAQSTWEVVEQKSKSGPHAKVEPGPTAEDRSYAECFAWAKRGGAPATSCPAPSPRASEAISDGSSLANA